MPRPAPRVSAAGCSAAPTRWSSRAAPPAKASGSGAGAEGCEKANNDGLPLQSVGVEAVASWSQLWGKVPGPGGGPVRGQHLGQIRRLVSNDMPDLVLYRPP